MDKLNDIIINNITGLFICAVFLYMAYAFHKQDKEIAEREKQWENSKS